MKKEKFKQLIVLLGLCSVPMVVVALSGCGMEQSFTCQMCGSSKTYTPIYASGTEENDKENIEYEYTSCIGPAGCTGCGLNTACWPTECMFVKESMYILILLNFDIKTDITF